MIELIEPLGRVPGVRLTALVSQDGVPVTVAGAAASDGADVASPFRDANVLAALSASCLAELVRATGGMSWGAPRRVVLRAARGTLLLLRTNGVVLVVVLDGGLCPDELWLQMEGVAARIARHVRALGNGPEAEALEVDPPRAALPGGGLRGAQPRSGGGRAEHDSQRGVGK